MGAGGSVLNESDATERKVIEKFRRVLELDERSRAKVVENLNVMADKMLKDKRDSRRALPKEVKVRVLSAVVEHSDVFSDSDCYVILELGRGGERKMTSTKSNTQKPSFNETFSFVPKAGERLPNLIVSAWDRDSGSDKEHVASTADFLGSFEIDLEAEPVSRNSFGVPVGFSQAEKVGNVQLTWHCIYSDVISTDASKSRIKPNEDDSKSSKETDETKAETKKEKHATAPSEVSTSEKDEKKSDDDGQENTNSDIQKTQPEDVDRNGAGAVVVVRKNALKMSDEEMKRFLDACREMMKRVDDKPGTGEYFRLAGYHGWPNDYCTHRQEVFPVWHRAYLVDFEHALQKADEKLGNDGNIGVPYWDFGASAETTEGPVIHPMLREMEFMKDDLIADPNGKASRLYSRGYSQIRTDEEMRQKLRDARVNDMLNACLGQTAHWKFASTRWGGGTSLESPHNMAHVAAGWPLSSVRFAAFHPLFFMIHANVDRYLDKYLELEPDSLEEFKQYQKKLERENGERNRFDAPLEPFAHPYTDEACTCADMFVSRELGYRYDVLPSLPPPKLRSMPVIVAFRGIDITPLRGRSFELHVFVAKRGNDVNPGEDLAQWSTHPNYGGLGVIFGGKGADCVNCKESKPVNVFVDVNRCLARLSLSRHEIDVLVWVHDVNAGTTCTLQSVKNVVIPTPRVEAPLFHSLDHVLEQERPKGEAKVASKDEDVTSKLSAQHVAGEVTQLQQQLKTYGYYNGDVDGRFGPMTDRAVKEFQRRFELRPDGSVGPVTKRVMSMTRVDTKSDVHSDEGSRHFKRGSAVYYVVGVAPGSIKNRKALIGELAKAFECWSEPTGLRFIYESSRGRNIEDVAKEITAQGDQVVRIQWKTREQDANFDGIGGTLADAGKDFITFDASERWILSSNRTTKPGTYRIFDVALHEIGHVVGLNHSDKAGDVMAPYYVAYRSRLTKNDKRRAAGLYN